MYEKLKHYFKEILTFFVLLAIVTNLLSFYKSLDLNKAPLDLKEFYLLDGKTYHLNTNEATIVHFWATWCPVCKTEAPNIEQISKKYQVITIAVDSGNKQEIKNYLIQHHLSFKVVNDITKSLAQQFHIQAYPTTLIYDRNGKLIFSDVGYTTTLGLYIRLFIVDVLSKI